MESEGWHRGEEIGKEGEESERMRKGEMRREGAKRGGIRGKEGSEAREIEQVREGGREKD